MSSKISFKDFYFYTIHGYSSRELEQIFNLSKSVISYQQRKYGLSNLTKHKKRPIFSFDKIDTPEKAYTLGFILADGCIEQNNIVEISVALKDKEVVDFISNTINGSVFVDKTYDKKQRRFPRARTNSLRRQRQRCLWTICSHRSSPEMSDRHYPRVKKDLERYLLLGFFDADGCITWGRRKDRNRIWHKICFTSSYSLLYGVQQHLLKIGITTTLRPKSNENCFVLEFSNRTDVLKFLDYIYPKNSEFIVLQRKYLKNRALRLELEENGEGPEKME